MAYPASTKTLGQWLDDVDRIATNVKLAAQQQNALSLAGNLDMDAIRRFFDQLVQANNTSPTTVLKFTTGETAAYRTVLAALLATIG